MEAKSKTFMETHALDIIQVREITTYKYSGNYLQHLK